MGNVEDTAIVARNAASTRYELNDILTVEQREFSRVKTGFLVGGTVGGAAIPVYGCRGQSVWSALGRRRKGWLAA